MKNLIIVFILFLTTQVFAQVDFRKEYYPAVNRAEMAITEDDYQTAFTEYQAAFSAVKTPLARDIFNAVACKFLQNDFEGAKPLLLKLAQKGISAEVLEKKEVFQIQSIKDKWISFKYTYENLIIDSESNFNTLMSQKVLSLKDSILANNRLHFVIQDFGRGSRYYNFRDYVAAMGRDDSTYLKSLQPVDSVFVKAIEKANYEKSKKYYYEGKSLMYDFVLGLQNGEEANFGFSDDVFSTNILLDELNFFFGNGFNVVNTLGGKVRNVEDSLKNQDKDFILKNVISAAKNGKINPMTALKLLNWPKEKASFRYNFINVFVINVEDTSGCSKLLSKKGFITYARKGYMTDTELEIFEKWKVEYGLDELENLIQKEIYSMTKNRYFALKNSKEIEESTVPNCSVAEQMLLNATIIQD